MASDRLIHREPARDIRLRLTVQRAALLLLNCPHEPGTTNAEEHTFNNIHHATKDPHSPAWKRPAPALPLLTPIISKTASEAAKEVI